MGNGKSKEQLKGAAREGLISTAIFNQLWYLYCKDGLLLPRVNAFAFLGSIAQDNHIDISESDLGEIIDSCSNAKGEFRYSDMIILFNRFAKEYRIGLTSTLEDRIEQEIDMQRGFSKKKHTPSSSADNPFLDNRAAPSRAEDLRSYVTEQIRSLIFISYLSLLPRDVLNCAVQYLEASEIMRNQVGIDKIWEVGDNVFGNEFLIRGNALLVLMCTRSQRVLKAVCTDNGNVLWESEKLIAQSWSGDELVCLNASGHIFYFAAKLVIFEPPNRHWIQALPLPPVVDVTSVQHRVYALCTIDKASRGLYCIELLPGKREFTTKLICKLAKYEGQGELQYSQTQFYVMSSSSHGDIAVISQPLEIAVVFLEMGRIATVKLDVLCKYYCPIISGSRLIYVGATSVRVHSLDDLDEPLYQYPLPIAVGQDKKCQLRAQPDGSVCAVHFGACITILQLNAQGEKLAERSIPLHILASDAPFAWHISGDTLLLATDGGKAHWISVSDGKMRMTEELHDGGFKLGIYLHGDYLISGGLYRLKCWKARV